MAPEVHVLDPLATRTLRWQVLRPTGAPPELPDGPVQGDETPGTVALAVLDEDSGEPLACGLLLPLSPPVALGRHGPADVRGFRLRGMATRPDRRGEGLGSAVLQAALARLANSGGGFLWCHARIGARTLYDRAGLVVEGEPFEEPGIGTHLLMWRLVEAIRSPEA